MNQFASLAVTGILTKRLVISPFLIRLILFALVMVLPGQAAFAQGAVTVEAGSGILDSTKVDGPRWRRIDFDALSTGEHTVTVSWDNTADVRFSVFQVLDAPAPNDTAKLANAVRGNSPTQWTGDLDSSNQYYLAVWSASGSTNFTATLATQTDDSAQLAILMQPANSSVIEGDDATFNVEATGSGTLSYQWLANGTPLTGQTGQELTVFSTSLAEDGTQYSVEISNGTQSITSDTATLSVNAPLVIGKYSLEADTSTWILQGPAYTLDYKADADSNGWGRTLLRVGDVLLVGGDFEGIKPSRGGAVTSRPFLAALDAVSGQPVTTFQTPFQVDSVVRSLVLSPDGSQVYVGGDFGLLVLDAATGQVEIDVTVAENDDIGRVFDIEVMGEHVYIGGDFNRVAGTYRANIARLSLDGELDSTWRPKVTSGYEAGRAAPVQAIALSSSGDTVYIGGNFGFIDSIPVELTSRDKKVSFLAVSALDGTVQPERFSARTGQKKALQVHDIAVTDNYVIIAWGGPNLLTIHDSTGERLDQKGSKGDVQALQVVGDILFVGHHGEFFGSSDGPNPPEAVASLNPTVLEPYKFHSFRLDDQSFPAEQAWPVAGTLGVWGIAAAEDSVWIAGQISSAGSNGRAVDGLVRFPAEE